MGGGLQAYASLRRWPASSLVPLAGMLLKCFRDTGRLWGCSCSRPMCGLSSGVILEVRRQLAVSLPLRDWRSRPRLALRLVLVSSAPPLPLPLFSLPPPFLLLGCLLLLLFFFSPSSPPSRSFLLILLLSPSSGRCDWFPPLGGCFMVLAGASSPLPPAAFPCVRHCALVFLAPSVQLMK